MDGGKQALKKISGLVPAVRWTREAPQILPRKRVLREMASASVGGLGEQKGGFSLNVLGEASPKRLHLIDPWKHVGGSEYEGSWYGGKSVGQPERNRRFERVKRRFRTRIETGEVHLHRMTFGEALEQLDDADFDWACIAGNHLILRNPESA